MTTPIKVEQVDRDAAADLYLAIFAEDADMASIVRCRNGGADHGPGVQTFARHRIAAEAKTREEDARMREGWQNAIFALEYWDRECRVAGKSPAWADGPTERTFIELRRFAAIRSRIPETDIGADRED